MLYFSQKELKEGSSVGFLRPKQEEPWTEACSYGTPISIAMVNGKGHKNFPSGRFASSSAHTLTKILLKIHKDKQPIVSTDTNTFSGYFKSFRRDSSQSFLRELLSHHAALSFHSEKSLQSTISSNPDFDLTVSELALYIDNHSIDAKWLHIYQNGDVLVLILRYTPSSKNSNHGYFAPVFKLKSQLNDSNNSLHRSFRNHQPVNYRPLYHSTEVMDGDIIITASKGVFNNVPISFLLFSANFLLLETLNEKIESHSGESAIMEQIEEFLKRFENEEEVQRLMENITKKARYGLGSRMVDNFFNLFTLLTGKDDEVLGDSPWIKNSQKNQPQTKSVKKISNVELPTEEPNKGKNVPHSVPRKLKHNFGDFFQCGLFEFIYEPKIYKNSKSITSRCVETSIETIFNFTKLHKDLIKERFNVKAFSKAILNVARRFMEEKELNISPYNVNEFMHSYKTEFHMTEISRSGKIDDAAVHATVVIEKNENEDEKFKMVLEDFQNESFQISQEILKDLENYKRKHRLVETISQSSIAKINSKIVPLIDEKKVESKTSEIKDQEGKLESQKFDNLVSEINKSAKKHERDLFFEAEHLNTSKDELTNGKSAIEGQIEIESKFTDVSKEYIIPNISEFSSLSIEEKPNEDNQNSELSDENRQKNHLEVFPYLDECSKKPNSDNESKISPESAVKVEDKENMNTKDISEIVDANNELSSPTTKKNRKGKNRRKAIRCDLKVQRWPRGY
jgi:hypothetical protein